MSLIEVARPLTDFVDVEDIPLGEYLPAAALSPLDGILVSEAWTAISEGDFTLAAKFHFLGVDGLHLPGFDQISLGLGDALGAEGRMVVGAKPFLELNRVGLYLKISKDILSTPAGLPAEFATTGTVRFDSEGFHFGDFDAVSLSWSRVAGTEIEIELTDIRAPSSEQAGVLFSIGAARVRLPMVRDETGEALLLEGINLTFGDRGPGGEFRMVGAALSATLAGFEIRIDDASVTLRNGELDSTSLRGALNVAPLKAAGSTPEWVAVEIGISSHGLSATLVAENGKALPQLEVQDLFTLDLSTIRLDAPTSGGEPVLWMSGGLTPHIKGVSGTWPTLTFDELGVTAKGDFRLAKGASIATDQPFTVGWEFATLTVTAFNFERPKDDPDSLELRISAGIELLKGIPAGASVDGLVARWTPGKPVNVSFSGIGISFGAPNAYAVDVNVSYDEKDHGFTGKGRFDLQALDTSLEVEFDSRTRIVDGKPIPTLFISAESELFPGGKPIGSTGLSFYGVNGLLAHNLELAVDNTAPANPRRYFDLFMTTPKIGFGISKWRPAEGAASVGLGVVIGTSDDGWAASIRGGLILQLPDLSILVTATADLLTSRPSMEDTTPGKFSALLAILPANNLMRLDFQADWTIDPLFSTGGTGVGEFYFNQPLNWCVSLGKKEAPISARMLKLGVGIPGLNDWLIQGNYYLTINNTRSVDVGANAAFGLRFGGGGLYAEVEGTISTDLHMVWSPFQMEGTAKLQGSARLVAGGLSLGFGLNAGLEVQLDHPKYFEVPLEACIHLDFGFKSFDICLSYNFSWRENIVPQPAVDFSDAISFVPQLWRSRLGATGADIDGVVTRRNPGSPALGLVQPHSEIILEFPKPVAVDVVSAHLHLNDVALVRPDLIGSRSGWQIRYGLTSLELFDETAKRQVDLFGTFARGTSDRVVNGELVTARPPNTSLRLLSSNRFGGPGPIGGGGVEDTPPPDCTPRPTIHRRCVQLNGLRTGAGRLPNGWLYWWMPGNTPLPRPLREKGVRLANGDTFTVFAPDKLQKLEATWLYFDGSTLPTPLPPEQVGSPKADATGSITLTDPGRLYLRLCWDELINAAEGGPTSGWTGPSGHETWTVPPEQRILHPGHDYALTIEIESRALDKQGNPSGAPKAFRRDYKFSTAGAPDWRGALDAAVAAVYPADGLRPVFLHYDLVVRFRDDFLRTLYQLDERALGIRLRDANGRLVEGPGGQTVHVPGAWRKAPAEVAPAEEWWRRARAGDPGSLCEGQPPIPPGETVLPIPLSILPLKPLARYTAELVAIGTNALAPKPVTDVLTQWSFTTSAFQTFRQLALQDPFLTPAALSQVTTGGASFDELIRSFAAPSVATVLGTRITPVRSENMLSYLLIEAPEPLDDAFERLSVTANGVTTELISNIDRTRIIARLTTPQDITGLPTLIPVKLDWQAAPAAAPIESLRTILSLIPAETCTWSVSLQALR